ncbi:MAG: hypothetical protein ACE5FL_12550 [Myxococcota bacterium]
MRRIGTILGAAIAAVILVLCVAFALIESGEVIVLHTMPDEGHDFIARLWIVDYQGQPWIGKADPSKAKWVARLRSDSRVEVTRGDVAECRQAVLAEDPAARREVYSLFQSKYRVPLNGSRLLGLLFGSNPDPAEAERSGVLFRLEPCIAGH